MSRIRQKPSGALRQPEHASVERANRPPSESLPKEVASALAEFDALDTRCADAERVAIEFTTGLSYDGGWKSKEATARKADADAMAAAARTGKALPSPTAHLDAAIKDRDAALAARTALQAARRAAYLDTAAAVSAWVDTHPLGNAEDAARADLRAALDEVARRALALARLVGLREWATSGTAYDDSTDLDAADVASLPSLGLHHGTSVPLAAVLDAIANL